MPRPPNILRPSRLTIALPEDLRAWLDLHLWSDSQLRVPQGAYSNLIIMLLRNYRKEIEDASVS